MAISTFGEKLDGYKVKGIIPRVQGGSLQTL